MMVPVLTYMKEVTGEVYEREESLGESLLWHVDAARLLHITFNVLHLTFYILYFAVAGRRCSSFTFYTLHFTFYILYCAVASQRCSSLTFILQIANFADIDDLASYIFSNKRVKKSKNFLAVELGI